MNAARKKRFAAGYKAEQKGEVRPVLLKQARQSGQLNLSNKSLGVVPNDVWHINDPPKESELSLDSNEKWWDQIPLNKLILSSNQLKEISEDIKILSALKVLDLHDNELEALPHAISELENLEKLDASHNKLKCVPDLGNCEKILSLLLQHNSLIELPKTLASLTSCEKLDLSDNILTSLPQCDGMNLKYLNLSNNKLSLLNVGCFSSLRYLDLSNNNFTTCPVDLALLVSLEQFYMRNNSISQMPSLTSCTELKEIYLGNNKISAIPDKLPFSLSILEVRDNKITLVPDKVVELKNLERLDVGNNNISNLPPEMGNMEKLKVVVLEGNPLRSIRRDIVNRGTQAVLEYLRSRVVPTEAENQNQKNQQDSPFSSDLSRKSEIANSGKLNVSKQNEIAACESLQEFASKPLKDINISYCAITMFPASLQNFSKSLKSLNLSCNKIKELPSAIGTFLTLSHLDVSTNLLTQLPPEISQLKSLIEVNICDNKFTSIPLCLCDCNNLENLLADGNQIEVIPAGELRKLEAMSILSLRNNCINQVPPELALLKRLRSVSLDGNTFRMPRQSILQRGPAAVLEYLKSRLPH